MPGNLFGIPSPTLPQGPGQLPVFSQLSKGSPQRLGSGVDAQAVLAVPHQFGRAAGVFYGDDRFRRQHRLYRNQPIIFLVGNEWHRQGVLIKRRQLGIAFEAQQADAGITIGQRP